MLSDTPTAEEVVIYGQDGEGPPDLRILHFNDVYHVDASSAEPVGGIARFMTLCKEYQDSPEYNEQSNLVTLFSGDAFNPSLESSVTKGSHMVPVLNNIGTQCAAVGNHDLDFGVQQFRFLTSQCTFPWLLANVLDPALGTDIPLGNAARTHMITTSNGIKIGIIGLAEREWLDTINSLPPNLIYKSASATAKELVPGLREQGAEIVIAITHQREPNDNKLAENTPDGLIDLILGGHDHYYNHSYLNGVHILRSGSDFKQLSYIEVWRRSDNPKKWNFKIVRRDVVSSIAKHAPTVELVENLTASLKAKLEKPIGYTAAPLDARFTTIRLKESNMGNFVCDLMKYYYGGDCCLMASGTIRGDQIYPPGTILMKDIMNCFPFEDPVIVIKVSGKSLLEAIENSVSLYPALEGRFPQVSHIEFEFDPKKPRMSRVKYVKVGNEPLDLERKYTLVTRGYMGRGKDGYSSLLVEPEGGDCKEIVSEENGVLISTILRQYFLSLKIIGKWKLWSPSLDRQWKAVNDKFHDHHPVMDPNHSGTIVGGDHTDAPVDESDDEVSDAKSVDAEGAQREKELVIMRKVTKKWWRLAGLKGRPQMCDKLGDGELMVNWTKTIAPRLEKRIRMTSS